MRVLVTGGAGFIGSHLAERLLADGREVAVLDDLSTGREANVAHLAGQPGFEMVVGSVMDESAVAALAGSADAIVHLAAAVGVRLIVERPVHTIETNVQGTEIVLRAAARGRTPVLLASTSEVYGRGERVPFDEEDDLAFGATSHPRGAYGCSKALDEWLGLAYHRERSVPVVVARLFNTVGPRQTGRYGMVLPTFARQALEGGPITVHGDGRQTRCFAHVADVVEALVGLLDDPDAHGRVYNVGSDEEVSMRELAERVRAEAGGDAEIVLVPYEEAYGPGFDDMRRRVPALARIEAAIGWKAERTLADIVADVVADQRSRIEG